MSAPGLFARLFLILALVAGSVAPGALAWPPVGEALPSASPSPSPCHEPAGDPALPPPADCCEGGCACDCLTPGKAALLASPARVPLPASAASGLVPVSMLASADVTPRIRPPIA